MHKIKTKKKTKIDARWMKPFSGKINPLQPSPPSLRWVTKSKAESGITWANSFKTIYSVGSGRRGEKVKKERAGGDRNLSRPSVLGGVSAQHK